MKNIDIIKRLYNDYTTKHLNKIILAIAFSILVAGATSAIAWLLDPAIEKIFINKENKEKCLEIFKGNNFLGLIILICILIGKLN